MVRVDIMGVEDRVRMMTSYLGQLSKKIMALTWSADNYPLLKDLSSEYSRMDRELENAKRRLVELNKLQRGE